MDVDETEVRTPEACRELMLAAVGLAKDIRPAPENQIWKPPQSQNPQGLQMNSLGGLRMNFETWWLKGGCSHGGHKNMVGVLEGRSDDIGAGQLEQFDNDFKKTEVELER